MSRIRRVLATGLVALLGAFAAVFLPGIAGVGAASAQDGASQSSLPTTSSPWDPQTTNVPYLAWAGEEVRLEKCFADPYLQDASSVNLSGVQATFLVEDWSGNSGQAPQLETNTANVFWSTSLNEPCVSENVVSLYPGFARVEVDVTDPNNVLGFPNSGTSSPIVKHQFLVGWMTLNTPSLTQLSASSFASTAQSEAAAEMGDPSGNGQFNAGTMPGYMSVKVTGSIPLNGSWASLIGQSSVTLPQDWALLANKLATDDVAANTQAIAANKWDISNDPIGVLGHVPQTPPCAAVPSQFISAPAAPPGTDSVDDCTGGGADGPFSTQFGMLSSPTSIGPFDPVRAADTLLPNGVLDWADAPMPAARVDLSIASNSGGATDTSGVGFLAPADKAKTYSRDFLGSATDPLPNNEYAPFYDQYIPATSAPQDASSGVDGGVANNFNGFLVNGKYHNWDFAATLASAGGGATSCLREAFNPQTSTYPANYYQLPSGPQSVAVYTDNHGEAQVQYVPGWGYYFDSLIASGAAIVNANGGCDLQSLYQVPGGLGTATIAATARYPFKPTDFPDMTSAPISVGVASLWSKSMTVYPKGVGTANNNARIITTHAQNIDGQPFSHELVCFFADSNAEGMSVFNGTVGGVSYGGVINAASFDAWAGQGAVCAFSDSHGNAAVEVLDSNSTTVDVIANFENEGILRDLAVSFATGDGTTTTTTTSTTSTTTSNGSPAPINSAPIAGPGVTSSAVPSSSTGISVSAPTIKTAVKVLRNRLALVRLITPAHGKDRVLLKVLSRSRTVKVRLSLVERLQRTGKHGTHALRRTVTRTVKVRANRKVSITVPNTVFKVSAKVA